MTPTVIRHAIIGQGFAQVISLGMTGKLYVQAYTVHPGGKTTLDFDWACLTEADAIMDFDDIVNKAKTALTGGS
jgi:hypothetical protein